MFNRDLSTAPDWPPTQKRVKPSWFDFRVPDYARVFSERIKALQRIRSADPGDLSLLKMHYREHIADFISDWGVTFDPRLVPMGLPGLMPFVLYDRQRDYVEWVVEKWRKGEPGLCEKSRDCGVSWLDVGIGCALCIFHQGMAVGHGAYLAEYVDDIGNLKATFPKARLFMQYLPREFRAGWRIERDAPSMQMNFPETGSHMSGQAGDHIGRGDRTSIHFVDEAAHIKHAALVEAALSQTTNCRIDVSSVAGMANLFAQKRHSGKVDVFVFDHRDDPRKGPAWYAKQESELDEVTLAQEVDRDYAASAEGIVIPGKWALAAIDALKILGISRTGARAVSFDVADEGADQNAACGVEGVEVILCEEWSGKGGDIFRSTERIFALCDEYQFLSCRYDGDGLGADVRGAARVINERRKKQRAKEVLFEAFRGSEGVLDPEREQTPGRKNKDFFANRKSQGWWSVRAAFARTYRWVKEGVPCDPDSIISISSACVGGYQQIITELSQPTYAINGAGKIVIDKTPNGARSPNRADALMMRFAGGRKRVKISSSAMARVLGLRR